MISVDNFLHGFLVKVAIFYLYKGRIWRKKHEYTNWKTANHKIANCKDLFLSKTVATKMTIANNLFCN